MRRCIIWLQAWYETLYIKFRQPELYRALTEPIDLADFGEVGPPGVAMHTTFGDMPDAGNAAHFAVSQDELWKFTAADGWVKLPPSGVHIAEPPRNPRSF